MTDAYTAKQLNDEYSREASEAWSAACAKRVTEFATGFSGDIFEDDTFVDFGGGDGQSARAFRDVAHCRCIVVDIAAERLAVARAGGIETVEARVEATGLPDASAQWAVCSHTLEHVEDLDAALREIKRVVKGAILFVVPLEDEAQAAKTASHVRYSPSEDWWLQQIRSVGFRIENHVIATAVNSSARELLALAFDPGFHDVWKQGASNADEIAAAPRTDVVIAFYRQHHLWERVRAGLLENAACINRVIIVNDERWGDNALNTADLPFPVTLLDHDHAGRGPSQSFNEGVAAATTDRVLLMEGDIVLPRGALLHDINWVRDKMLLLRGVVRVDPDDDKLVLQENVREALAADRTANLRAWYLMHCNYLLCDRTAFLALNGFDEAMCALHANGGYSEEDTDLGVRWMAAYGYDSLQYRRGVEPVVHLGGRKNKRGDDNAATPMEARIGISRSMGVLYQQHWHLFCGAERLPDHVNVAHLNRTTTSDVRLDCMNLDWLPMASAERITTKLPLEYFCADRVTDYIEKLLLRLAPGGVLDLTLPNYPLYGSADVNAAWNNWRHNWQFYTDIEMVEDTAAIKPHFIFTRRAAA